MAGSAGFPGRERANVLEREAKAVALKAAGATYAEVGRVLGTDRSNAAKIVRRALEREHSEAVALMRQVEGERLDRLQRGLWLQATQGDVQAAMGVLRVMERRARLFGLDAPARVQVTTELDAEIDSLVQQLADLSVVEGEVVHTDQQQEGSA